MFGIGNLSSALHLQKTSFYVMGIDSQAEISLLLCIYCKIPCHLQNNCLYFSLQEACQKVISTMQHVLQRTLKRAQGQLAQEAGMACDLFLCWHRHTSQTNIESLLQYYLIPHAAFVQTSVFIGDRTNSQLYCKQWYKEQYTFEDISIYTCGNFIIVTVEALNISGRIS